MQKAVTRRSERGFALLFIFALAGIAAVMLYNELPRAVFESQRAKEELLISRGQEYQRGIQLYYRKFRKYPATMEELEKSSGIRFLRRRYVDPFSGKDDWRIIHVGPNGQFIDSKVIKPPQPAQGTGFGSSTTGTTEEVKDDPNDPATKKRASDTSASEIGGNGNNPGAPPDPNALPGAPPPPASANGSRTGNDPNYPQQNYPQQNYPQQGNSQQGYPPQGFGGVGSIGTGLPNTSFPSNGVNSQNGGSMGMPIQQGNGIPQNQNGQRPLTPEQLNPALDVIQRLLTQPRQPPPGVFSGNAPSGGNGQFGNSSGPITNPGGSFMASGPAANGGNGQFGGGGIAGVASKHEGKGIKLVNERDRIEEWEFIYDYGKDRGGRPNTNTQSQQGNPGGMNPGGMNPGGMNPAQGSGFGGNSGGFGGNSGGFGGNSGGFGNQQPSQPNPGQKQGGRGRPR